MKNLFATTMIAAAFTTLVTTDANAQKGFYIGIQTGVQATDALNKSNIDQAGFKHKLSLAPTVGINGGYNFNDHIGVSTEVSVAREGQHYKLHGVELRSRQTYLKVPVFFTYNTNPTSKVIFTAKLGPQVGVLLNSKLKDADRKTLISDTKDDFSTVTYGAAGGIGVRMAVAKNLYFDAGLKLGAHYGKNKEVKYSDNISDNLFSSGKKTYKTLNTNAGVEVGLKYFF